MGLVFCIYFDTSLYMFQLKLWCIFWQIHYQYSQREPFLYSVIFWRVIHPNYSIFFKASTTCNFLNINENYDFSLGEKILSKIFANIINIILWPRLLPNLPKWNPLHQVIELWSKLGNLEPQPSSKGHMKY